MFDITAYCDESMDDQTGIFVLAGYVATLGQWEEFDRLWRVALRNDGLAEFKASDCESGRREFKGWTVGRRRGSCERFTSVIRGARLTGGASVIDLRAYAHHRQEIESLRTIPTGHGANVVRYGDPYYLAFQHVTEILTLKTKQAPPEEHVTFIFDLNNAYKDKARVLFDGVRGDTTNTFHDRMGSATFADSKAHPGLQAADLLAFEVRRHFAGHVYERTEEVKRWQWDRLAKGRTVSLTLEHFNAESIDRLLSHFRDQWGETA